MPGKSVFIGFRASIFVVSLLVTSSWAAINWKEKVLHDFGGGADGAGSYASLISDAVGNFYGTTTVGGAYGDGTVFELSSTVGGGWTETVLHNFNQNGTDGAFPQARLIFDAVGNLYGTTMAGGMYYNGTAFELSPTAGGGWTETVLHNFINNGTDGASPYSGLIFDAAGNLFGTTAFGGTNYCVDYLSNGCGTVFKLSPTQDGGWTETVLHNFSQNYLDGYYPFAGLTLDASGDLFGTTLAGGTHSCNDQQVSNSCGTVFKLSPAQDGEWTETVLHNFSQNYVDGYYPWTGLMLDASGNLFGTTGEGGEADNGTAFELSPTAGGGWSETVLYSFCSQTDCADGADPAEPILDAAGNLYGMTSSGGTYREGTVFELSPTEGGSWTETVLHNFNENGTDGAFPTNAGLILDATGNLFGTTPNGGTYPCGRLGCGTVFELSPVHACIRCSHAGRQ
jgi:uncharacterized repeat protein (TIGR03803 family)